MSQSRIRYLVLAVMSLVVMTACSINGSSNGTSQTSTKTPAGSVAKPTGSVPAGSQAQGTASTSNPATPDAVSLDPPLLVAHAQSGTQPANFGTFYWMLSNGLAAQVNARGIEIQKSTLHVTKGETIQFTWENQNSKSESTLQDLTIAVFPEAQSIVTETSGTGTMKGFKASENPVAKETMSTSNPTWTVSVGPGTYFVQVLATWSNPVVADKTRHCEYGFYFTVG